jgi:phosphoglucomutase
MEKFYLGIDLGTSSVKVMAVSCSGGKFKAKAKYPACNEKGFFDGVKNALDGLFEKYGFCREFNVELYMEGVDGPQKMAAMLDSYRTNIPAKLGGVSVTTFGDYNAETFVDVASGQRTPTGLPKTNMLIFKLENGDVVIIRPSGTEPKVKIYFLVIANDAQEADTRITEYRKSLNV